MTYPSQSVVNAEYLRGDTVHLARSLLDCWLCRRMPDGNILRLPVTETEAYDGFEDRASHAFGGRTPRNAPMFGDAGIWYVYLCYGMHWMLNIVTREADYPAAVLLRGAGAFGGPAKLTKAIAVDKAFNGLPAVPASGLWLEWGTRPPKRRIKALPRVGVDYAGKAWAGKPWRFQI